MNADFPKFSRSVAQRFELMSQHELYVMDSDRDAIWSQYLNAFPQGSNPVFRVNTAHDCSCCRHFVRTIGNVVAIVDGAVQTVWDIEGLEHPYDVVAATMAEHIRSLQIRGVFRTKERQFGAEKTRELLEDQTTRTWHHFVAKIADRHFSPDADSVRGVIASTAGVFRRGVNELTADSLETISDLIASKALYRGEEHKAAVDGFQALMRGADASSDQSLFIWENVRDRNAGFRNTVIGTLAQDLSEGKDIEAAVKAFEAKVAPENYKRPTALITPRMVDAAMATIGDLGLEPALERRFARLSDVAVTDVLFVDNSVQGQMKGGIREALMEEATVAKPSLDGALELTIDDFMAGVVPKASSIDLLVENSMMGNFVSLTAPVQDDAPRLFKWPNGFAWSYDGDVADSSIKERVKRAGGRVDATLRVSLAWTNTDDLDIHVHEPDRNHIHYGNKCGKLDVDMNVSTPVRDAVENVCWNRPADGDYVVKVHNYTHRESRDVGFTLEVQSETGAIETFTYAHEVRNNQMVPCLTMTVKDGRLVAVKMAKGLTRDAAGQDKWGITTQSLVKVNTLMLSPNHWGDAAVGNRHWMFMLDGCKNPGTARGIYNEFLLPALEPHRKVFEVLGAKTKCPPAEEQLSGLGFSSTRKAKVKFFVRGTNVQRAYSVQF